MIVESSYHDSHVHGHNDHYDDDDDDDVDKVDRSIHLESLQKQYETYFRYFNVNMPLFMILALTLCHWITIFTILKTTIFLFDKHKFLIN